QTCAVAQCLVGRAAHRAGGAASRGGAAGATAGTTDELGNFADGKETTAVAWRPRGREQNLSKTLLLAAKPRKRHRGNPNQRMRPMVNQFQKGSGPKAMVASDA